MKYSTTIIIFFFSINLSFSQALEHKNIVIDLGIGFPPLNYFSQTGFSNSNNKINLGTFFVNGEVFLTDKIGLRGTVMYAYYKNTNHLKYTLYDPTTGQTNSIDYEKIKTVNIFKFLIGPNFHLYRTKNLDTYLGLGFGLNKQFSKTTTSVQIPQSQDGLVFSDFDFYIPIAIRVSYGLRYFINEYWAITTEFGLGGPVISIGITNKIF